MYFCCGQVYFLHLASCRPGRGAPVSETGVPGLAFGGVVIEGNRTTSTVNNAVIFNDSDSLWCGSPDTEGDVTATGDYVASETCGCPELLIALDPGEMALV